MDFYSGNQRINIARIFSSSASLFICYSILAMLIRVDGWTCHYSNKTMNWMKAREWCKEHYTEIVAIENREENVKLNDYLPRQGNNYWIGIRKITGVWTWVRNNKSLEQGTANWATDEPNNTNGNEDCVEFYVKYKENGKWNDENCLQEKTALCYKAYCRPGSCSGNGKCVEILNNHTCECHQGFYGVHCENAIDCEELNHPSHGFINCFHPFGNYSYRSECQFSCEDGYQLVGSRTIQCTASREWSAAPPHCKAVDCEELNHPSHGFINCFHPFGNYSYRSECQFSCEDGYQLVGSRTIQCTASREWSAAPPHCKAHLDPVIVVLVAVLVAGGLSIPLIVRHQRNKVKKYRLDGGMSGDNPPQVYRNST
ncbi:L-selectin-like isoform X2 [Anguilla rostrata]|uniref:L-selectin-like isoform X2 n=1 Tax=Anguilla rostrata TaxID=7938 RepID=UPI0030CB83CC